MSGLKVDSDQLSKHAATRPSVAIKPPRLFAAQHAPWTPERSELVRKYWSEGLSASQICARIGNTTRNAVIGRVRRMGLDFRVTKVQAKRQRPPQPPRLARCKPEHQRPIEFRGPPKDPAPMPLPAADDIARVSLIDLEPHHCRFPVGEPTQGFCGCPKVPGVSYCEGHMARAYRVSPVVSRAPAKVREFA